MNAPYKTLTVGAILDALPPGTVDELLGIVNASHDGAAEIKLLKGLFRRHAVALREIGLEPDYLAYAFHHHVIRLRMSR